MMIRRSKRSGSLLPFILVVLFCAGCDRDVRLAGHRIRDVQVREVTHFGQTLNKNASPEQVTYVLLRAIREDFQSPDAQTREAALDVQFDTAAADQIRAVQGVDLDPNEMLHRMVHRWTPGLSHYVGDFETEWDSAKARFKRIGPQPRKNSKSGELECEVLLKVSDPTGDPNANALVRVGLIQDGGFWRVVRVGLAPGLRDDALRKSATAGVAEPASGKG